MRRSIVVGYATVALGVLALALSGTASAQNPVEIRATAPEKPAQIHIVEPSPATREQTRPREAEFYGTDVRVKHEPAFIEPFVGQTAGGTKYGLSGWTSPSTPVGSYVSQEPWARTGWPAIGISVVWDSVPATSPQRVSNPR
jgi:hypothetical protein